MAEALREAVKDDLEGLDGAAVMFSGGLDSSVLAVLARKHCPVTLYTLGDAGSSDLMQATECAGILDLPLVSVTFTRQGIEESIRDVVLRHGMARAKWMTTFVSFDLVMRKIRERHVLCGQGADELFGGYRKYHASPEPRTQMDRDLATLAEEEMPMYRRLASNYGKELLTPYLSLRVMHVAKELGAEPSADGQWTKPLLREAAAMLGVPGMMAQKPKKAMQYGSGVSAELRRLLKGLGTDLDGYIHSVVELGK